MMLLIRQTPKAKEGRLNAFSFLNRRYCGSISNFYPDFLSMTLTSGTIVQCDLSQSLQEFSTAACSKMGQVCMQNT